MFDRFTLSSFLFQYQILPGWCSRRSTRNEGVGGAATPAITTPSFPVEHGITPSHSSAQPLDFASQSVLVASCYWVPRSAVRLPLQQQIPVRLSDFRLPSRLSRRSRNFELLGNCQHEARTISHDCTPPLHSELDRTEPNQAQPNQVGPNQARSNPAQSNPASPDRIEFARTKLDRSQQTELLPWLPR